MSEKFTVVKRPAHPVRRGHRAVSPVTLAIIETVKTGKAIELPDERRAKNARMSTTIYLQRQKRLDLAVRKNGVLVWVERRKADK